MKIRKLVHTVVAGAVLATAACANADASTVANCPPVADIDSGTFVEVGAEIGLREPDDGTNQFGVFGLAVEMGGGVAVWDLDSDGWDDVVATYPNRTPKILLNRCGTCRRSCRLLPPATSRAIAPSAEPLRKCSPTSPAPSISRAGSTSSSSTRSTSTRTPSQRSSFNGRATTMPLTRPDGVGSGAASM